MKIRELINLLQDHDIEGMQVITEGCDCWGTVKGVELVDLGKKQGGTALLIQRGHLVHQQEEEA